MDQALSKPLERATVADGRPRLPTGTGDDGTTPLAPGQRQLWFLDRLCTSSSAYHVSSAYTLRGRLYVAALARALTDVVNRHHALRTAIVTDELGRPVGLVRRHIDDVRLSIADLSGSPTATDPSLEHIAADAMHRPFDLAADLLVRATLVRLARDRHVLILVFHHAVIDGWSLGIVTRELAVRYGVHIGIDAPRLPPVRHQYPDYAAWCRIGAIPDRSLAYWKRALADAPSSITVPSDRPRTASGDHPGRALDFAVPTTLARDIRKAAAGCGVSTFTVALTAFAVLIGQYAEVSDVMVGVPAAGRGLPEFGDVVGYFVNLLPLRIDLSGQPPWRVAVTKVGRMVAEALDHEQVPFDRIVRDVGAARRPGYTPLVQVMFQLFDERGLGRSTEGWPGLTVEEWTAPIDASTRFDIEISLRDRDDGCMVGSLIYDCALYRTTTARAIRDRYLELLGHLWTEPDAVIPIPGTE